MAEVGVQIATFAYRTEPSVRNGIAKFCGRERTTRLVTYSRWRARIGVIGLAAPFLSFTAGITVMVIEGWPRFGFLPTGIANHLIRYFPFLVILTCLGGWLLYLLDACTNPLVASEKRGLWVAVLSFGGFVVMPFYFWWYIRPHVRKGN